MKIPGKHRLASGGLTRRRTLQLIGAGALALSCPRISWSGILTGGDNKGKIFPKDAPDKPWRWSREAKYYLHLGRNVQCRVCPNKCTLEPGDRSVCRVKVNIGSRLYTLAYGNPCALNVDPIEKKPLYHFLPGSRIFSIATAGCNLRCLNCQNWEISQSRPEDVQSRELFPAEVAKTARAAGCRSIAYTYSEPTAYYEYTLDSAVQARADGLKNVTVTNGYINPEPLAELCRYLDASQVDIKNFKDKKYLQLNGGHLEPVLTAMQTIKKSGVWLEVSTLVVPTYSDDLNDIREMSRWIKKNLGPDVPFHFLRFFPQHRLQYLPPTPVSTMNRAREIAREEGLYYIYLGNVPQRDASQTFCPHCKKLVADRLGFEMIKLEISNSGRCRFCGAPIAGVWA